MLESAHSQSSPLSDASLINALDLIGRQGNDPSPVLFWFTGPMLFSRSIALGETGLLVRACRRAGAVSSVHSILITVANALAWNASFLSHRPSLWFQQVVNYLNGENLIQSAGNWLTNIQGEHVQHPMLLETFSIPAGGTNAGGVSRTDLPANVYMIRRNPARTRSWVVAGVEWVGVIELANDCVQINFGLSIPSSSFKSIAIDRKGRVVATVIQMDKQSNLSRYVIDTESRQVTHEIIGRCGGFAKLSSDGTLILYDWLSSRERWGLWDATNDKIQNVPRPPDAIYCGVDRSREGIPECFGIIQNGDGTGVWTWNARSKTILKSLIPEKILIPSIRRSESGHLYCIYGQSRGLDQSMQIVVIDRNGDMKWQKKVEREIVTVLFDENAARLHLVERSSLTSLDLKTGGVAETLPLGLMRVSDFDIDPFTGEVGLVDATKKVVFSQLSRESVSLSEIHKYRNINDFAYDPSGDCLVISDTSTFYLVDADTGACIREMSDYVGLTESVRFVPRTSLMVSASPSIAVVRDLYTGSLITKIFDDKNGGSPKIYVPQAGMTASVTIGRTVHQIVTNEIARRFPAKKTSLPTDTAFDSAAYVAGQRDGEFFVSLRDTGEEIAWFPLRTQAKGDWNNIFGKSPLVGWVKRPNRAEWAVWDDGIMRVLRLASEV